MVDLAQDVLWINLYWLSSLFQVLYGGWGVSLPSSPPRSPLTPAAALPRWEQKLNSISPVTPRADQLTHPVCTKEVED